MCQADKAPLEVVSILKGLLEDGEMVLSDGRRIVRELPAADAALEAAERKLHPNKKSRFIVVHPEFRCIVLANRPG